jgi:hypothetical protein
VLRFVEKALDLNEKNLKEKKKLQRTATNTSK